MTRTTWSEETRQAVVEACRAVARDAARRTPDGDLIAAHLLSAQCIMAWGGADDAASQLYQALIHGTYYSRQEMHDRLDAIMDAAGAAACYAS